MSDHSKREYSFRKLLEDNLIVSDLLRKVAGNISDTSLKDYFQSLSNKRSQFASELSDEIAFYGGKKPFFPPNAYDRRWNKLAGANTLRIIKKIFKLHKQSLGKYQVALGQINDGSCREILIRHKAYVENSLYEFKALKTLLKYRDQQSETTHKNHYETN